MHNKTENCSEFTVLSNMLAHKLRTSFLTIKTGAYSVKEMLKILADCYTHTESSDFNNKKLSQENIKLTFDVLTNIERQAQFSDFFLNFGLFSFGNFGSNALEKQSFGMWLNSALSDFHNYFEDIYEQLIIKLDVNDFYVEIDAESLKMILISIFYNCVVMHQLEEKSNIHILTHNSSDCNVVTFHCSKVFCTQEKIKTIFHKFYFDDNGHTCFGLFGCINAMNKIGGSMKCKFIPESQTLEYELSFPRVSE
jgi:hypothetical protein